MPEIPSASSRSYPFGAAISRASLVPSFQDIQDAADGGSFLVQLRRPPTAASITLRKSSLVSPNASSRLLTSCGLIKTLPFISHVDFPALICGRKNQHPQGKS